MSKRVAINGYGRIGQDILRAIYSSAFRDEFEVVAINEMADLDTIVYATRFDTTYGRFPVEVERDNGDMMVGGDRIRVLNAAEPENLPWGDLGVELVFECSGSYGDRETADRHLASGAGRILFSHPATKDVDATIVRGFNLDELQAEHRVASCGSCTTNCAVPVLDLLDRAYGVTGGVSTTIHSVMNDQTVIDKCHQTNLRLTRSAMQSIIPVETYLSEGLKRLMPDVGGTIECLHMRVPTLNVSVMDFSINVKTPTTVEAVNALFRDAAGGALNGVLDYSEEPHASVDFNQDPHSLIVDGTQTRVSTGTLIKLICWFDNEWGYSNRMLDVGRHWLSL